MRNVVWMAVAVWWVMAGGSSAHEGPVDACGGHTAQEWVEYAPRADGTPTVPSEAGEYHFHLAPAEIEEARASLREYRRVRLEGGSLLPGDLGSFLVGERAYDIWQYTRQQEAILHCQGDDEITHAGIVRVRLAE